LISRERIHTRILFLFRMKYTSYNETTERTIMPTYSFGAESILKVELTEEQADGYNRFLTAFFAAQERMREAGTPWDPRTMNISIDCEADDLRTFNEVGRLIQGVLDNIDQDKRPIELYDDYLVRN
jgi:hypothetical protein